MDTSTSAEPSVLMAAWNFWSERRLEDGSLAASRATFAAIWEFIRDSTPTRLRSRFGDAGYDWDHRVNTTSGAVGWKDRLLGAFHSPYQPTEPELFQEMIECWQNHAQADFNDFTFVDLGSGKGRTLLMASQFPFRRIIGVELLPSLHRIALENLALYKSDSQRCFKFESICADATNFSMPDGPLLLYLFNPFPEFGLRRTLSNLKQDLETNARRAYVLYHNPQLESVLEDEGFLRKIAGTHQYSIYAASP